MNDLEQFQIFHMPENHFLAWMLPCLSYLSPDEHFGYFYFRHTMRKLLWLFTYKHVCGQSLDFPGCVLRVREQWGSIYNPFLYWTVGLFHKGCTVDFVTMDTVLRMNHEGSGVIRNKWRHLDNPTPKGSAPSAPLPSHLGLFLCLCSRHLQEFWINQSGVWDLILVLILKSNRFRDFLTASPPGSRLCKRVERAGTSSSMESWWSMTD